MDTVTRTSTIVPTTATRMSMGMRTIIGMITGMITNIRVRGAW